MGRFKLYDFRHTYASHLLDQGIKPVDVADVLGHKNVATTPAFYAHRVPRDMGYIAERLTAARLSVRSPSRPFFPFCPRYRWGRVSSSRSGTWNADLVPALWHRVRVLAGIPVP